MEQIEPGMLLYHRSLGRICLVLKCLEPSDSEYHWSSRVLHPFQFLVMYSDGDTFVAYLMYLEALEGYPGGGA
jgi:hypothetical protein